MPNPKPADSKFTEEDLKKQVRLLRSQGPDIFFVFENVYRYEEKGVGEGGEMRKVEGGKIKVRNRHRLNQLQEIKVIRQLVGSEGYDGYLVHFNNPGQAIDVLGLLGTKTIEYKIQRKGDEPKVSGVCTDVGTINKMRGHPRSKVTILVPDFKIHHTDLPHRIEMRILLREGLWHEIMELAILAINGRVFDDPVGLATGAISMKAVAGSIIDQAVDNALRQKSKHDFYPWEGDIEEDGDAWAHQAKTWEEEAERLEGVALMLENQGKYIRANSVWAECAEAWEKAAQAWDASTFPEARDKAKEARKKKEKVLDREGHWQIIEGPMRAFVTIFYFQWKGTFQAVIKDYGGRHVEDIYGSSPEQGLIIWGKNKDPGKYLIDVKMERETQIGDIYIYPTKDLEWEAKVEYRNDDPYFVVTPKTGCQWPVKKGLYFQLQYYEGHAVLYTSEEITRSSQKVVLGPHRTIVEGKSYTIKPCTVYASDPVLKELLEKGKYIKPTELSISVVSR